ncbi:hypothetical protein, partial [Proteus mirabilis]
PADGGLHRGGARFDPWALSWAKAAAPAGGVEVSPVEAVSHLFARTGTRRLPVGVIGPRDATPTEYERAHS